MEEVFFSARTHGVDSSNERKTNQNPDTHPLIVAREKNATGMKLFFYHTLPNMRGFMFAYEPQENLTIIEKWYFLVSI